MPITHVRYINILTWLRGFRVKTAIFLSYFCTSIPKRDLNTKKTTPSIEAWPEGLRAMLEYWYIAHGLFAQGSFKKEGQFNLLDSLNPTGPVYASHTSLSTHNMLYYMEYHFRHFLPVDSCCVSLLDASCQLPWKCEEAEYSCENFCTILIAAKQIDWSIIFFPVLSLVACTLSSNNT